MRYLLCAELGDRTSKMTFEEINNTEAMYAAIFRILDKASKNVVWARGAITLTNLDTQEILNKMGAK